jgi:hypothetical protein
MTSNMISRGRWYISTDVMNRIVRDFCLTMRPWPAYPADKIEVMARWSGKVPADALYAGFDANNELLIFTSPVDFNEHQDIWSRLRRFFRKGS